nr:AlpA family phage regulatory protein [Isorropodon fossajaponicum symbiont]
MELYRAKEVQNMTGLSRTTLWRLENKGEFPYRVSLGGNSVGWKLSEIKGWIDER